MEKLAEIFVKIADIDPSRLTNTDLLNLFVSISSLAVAILSFAVSMIALIYTGYQFLLKVGTRFYGSYTTSSSVWSSQRYVSEIIIENKKDKAAAIDFIYLRVASNIYLELVDYSGSPRIVAPFETIKVDLREGVSGYISSTYKVDLGSILKDRKVRKTLVVATPQGLCKVRRYKKYWNVYIESLRNNFIIPVRPVRKYFKGKEYGDGLQFVVSICKGMDEFEEVFLYRGNTYSINDKSIKVDDFVSAELLQDFIGGGVDALENNVKVERVGYTFSDYETYEGAEVFHSGYFGTHVVGKIYTWFYRRSFEIREKISEFRKKWNL